MALPGSFAIDRAGTMASCRDRLRYRCHRGGAAKRSALPRREFIRPQSHQLMVTPFVATWSGSSRAGQTVGLAWRERRASPASAAHESAPVRQRRRSVRYRPIQPRRSRRCVFASRSTCWYRGTADQPVRISGGWQCRQRFTQCRHGGCRLMLMLFQSKLSGEDDVSMSL